MKGFLVLITVAVGVAEHVDWSKVEPRNISPKIFDFLPVREAPKNQGRITGGSEVKPHSIPYQVGLRMQVGNKTGWCGGSLISPLCILTAAHCLDGASNGTVYLGAHNVKDEEENRIEMQVSRFIIHPDWYAPSVRNDIGVIKLPWAVTFSDKIKAITLPSMSNVNTTYEGQLALASGWGKDTDSATTISPVLRSISTPISEYARCKLVFIFTVTKNNICISGNSGVSTCNGDSGGPLVVNESDATDILIGITSFGSGKGCQQGSPAVFTRVPAFLPWIYANTDVKPRE